MAYIRQYKGRWRAEVQKHGLRETHMADTKREARAWALRKENELDAPSASGGRSLQAAVAHYLDTVRVHKRNPDHERKRLEAALAYFGAETPLAKIDSQAVGRWRDHRIKTVSGSTVQREANLLRNLFSRASDEWRWIPAHSCLPFLCSWYHAGSRVQRTG